MKKFGSFWLGLDVSEQEFIDCGYGKNDANGCNGATPHAYAKTWSDEGRVLVHEKQYQYRATHWNRYRSEAVSAFWSGGWQIASRKFLPPPCEVGGGKFYRGVTTFNPLTYKHRADI